MIGGGKIDNEITEYSVADAYGKNAMEGIKLAVYNSN